MALLTRALPLLLCACALGGGSGSGDEALPVAGVGPFAKLTDPTGATPLTEPYLVVDPLASISDPSAVVLADGTIRIFYTRGGSEIWRADVPASLAAAASDPVSSLAPEGDEVRAVSPCALLTAGRLRLYYETAAGVARATSSDDGESFTRDGVVLAGARSPGVLDLGDRVLLYFGRAGDPALWVATSTDGLAFSAAADPVLSPSAGWDGKGLGDPAPVGGIGATGDLHVGLYYTGTGPTGVVAIGYAGSTDGLTFEALPAPVLDAAAPSERGPTAIVHPDRVLLLFSQDRSGKQAIAVATDP